MLKSYFPTTTSHGSTVLTTHGRAHCLKESGGDPQNKIIKGTVDSPGASSGDGAGDITGGIAGGDNAGDDIGGSADNIGGSTDNIGGSTGDAAVKALELQFSPLQGLDVHQTVDGCAGGHEHGGNGDDHSVGRELGNTIGPIDNYGDHSAGKGDDEVVTEAHMVRDDVVHDVNVTVNGGS